MKTTTTRRAVLAGAATLPAAALPALSDAATGPSPVQALFEDWKRARAWAREPGVGDDEGDRRAEVLIAIEERLVTAPAESMSDLAIKIAVMATDQFLFIPGQAALATDAHRILSAEGIDAAGVEISTAGDPRPPL